MHPLVLALIVITGLLTNKGLVDRQFFNRFAFQITGILKTKQWDRLLYSITLHVDWMHFGFNMFVLYIFAGSIIYSPDLGVQHFLLLYILAGLVGGLFALLIHKNEAYYTAVGASGAVSGIVFAAISLDPQMPLAFIFLPLFSFPAWVFAIGYLLYSVFGLQRRMDNLGHSAHIGGAVTGIIYPLIFNPNLFIQNSFYIFAMLLPVALLLMYVLKKN